MTKLTKQNTRNQTFQYLEALIILMVIDDHTNNKIGFLSSIFPYNSFYMPFLVFISGYFYRKKPIMQHLIHKIRKLLLPYMIWNLAGEGIAYILMRLDIVYWYGRINWQSLKYCLVSGPLSSINGASWFVIMLFYVSVTYNIICNFIKKEGISVDSVFLAIYIIAGCGALVLCMKGKNKGIYLPILRAVFYLQFYHIGHFFCQYLESRVQKLSKAKLCVFCIFLNIVLICLYGRKINFVATSGMGNFNSSILPLITSITGILFWYEVMSYLSKKIGQLKFIDFIAQNTFTIMETHLLFVNIPNFYVFFCITRGLHKFLDFNIQNFKESAWFRYNDNASLVGFFCGLCGSLITAYIINKAKRCLCCFVINNNRSNLNYIASKWIFFKRK